jgi:hypothetical protein
VNKMLLGSSTAIRVVHGDVTEVRSDFLILKVANGFHGADEVVATKLGFKDVLGAGKHVFLSTHDRAPDMATAHVLFFGVGQLQDFRYANIQVFAFDALHLCLSAKAEIGNLNEGISVATTAHGPGYGLDEREAFFSLLSGFSEALNDERLGRRVREIIIIERDKRTVERLKKLVEQFTSLVEMSNHNLVQKFGKVSESKPTIFIAMPFAEEFDDEWHAITEAGESVGYKMERLDIEPFVGDIMSEIRRRIEGADAIVALLNGRNANVFLELGYAWGKGKPTILVLKDGEQAPFDVQGQRQLRYKSSFKLRDLLRNEIDRLSSTGAI